MFGKLHALHYQWNGYKKYFLEDYIYLSRDAANVLQLWMQWLRKWFIFFHRYKTWDMAIQCLSVLDVLMSLAKYVGAADGVTCRPEIIEPKADTEVNGGQDLEEEHVLIQI